MRLDDDMRRVVREQSLGFVATVCPDGTANLSPKGTTIVWDDEHLVFLHIHSPGTIANLAANPSIEINVVDPIVRKGYRFKGRGEVLTEGDLRAEILDYYRRERGTDIERVQAVVLVRVETVAPVISPSYDSATSEAEIITRWRDHYQSLADALLLNHTGAPLSSDRISASRRIAAPASVLFRIVSSPDGHVQIDGSGMLEAAPDARQLSAVGETFDMDMDREPLGDIPDMGKYKVRNTVTQLVPDRLFEWAVGGLDRPPVGHVYGWQLEPVGDSETEVTNYCDWTNISDAMRQRREWPIVPVHMLEKSVENLERIATRG